MNSPTPAQFSEFQLRICCTVQQQLAVAVEEGNFNAIAAIARTLKDLTSSYRDVAGSGSSPSKLFSQGLGYSNPNLFGSTLIPEPTLPKTATSYAYPDGFEGVTLSNSKGDVWDE